MTNHWIEKEKKARREATTKGPTTFTGPLPDGFLAALKRKGIQPAFVEKKAPKKKFPDVEVAPDAYLAKMKMEMKIKLPDATLVGRQKKMGLTPNHMNTVWPMAFRWTFTPTDFRVEPFLKTCKIDFVNKELDLEIYAVVDPVVEDWLNSCNDYPALKAAKNKKAYESQVLSEKRKARNAQLAMWDGCGNLLYEYRVKGMTLREHFVELDYASSDIKIHKVKIACEAIDRLKD